MSDATGQAVIDPVTGKGAPGVQQWLRVCSLTIEDQNSSVLIDLSQMRIVFRVTSRLTVVQPDTAEITVYNLSDRTRKLLLTMPIVPPGDVIAGGPGSKPSSTSVPAGSQQGVFSGDNWKDPKRNQSAPAQVTLVAGYPGNQGIIFQGQLVQVRHGRESATDRITLLNAADGDSAHKWGLINTSLSKGYLPQDILDQTMQVFNKYGCSVGNFPTDTNTPPKPAPRGKSIFNMGRDVLDDVASTYRCNWYINKGNVEFLEVTAYKPDDIIDINKDSGMIGMPHQTAYGVSVTTLLNPAIGRASTVNINSNSVQRAQFQYTADLSQGTTNRVLANNLDADGRYKVIMVNHSGDTRGNEWYTTAECISVDPTNPGRTLGVSDQSLVSLLR